MVCKQNFEERKSNTYTKNHGVHLRNACWAEKNLSFLLNVMLSFKRHSQKSLTVVDTVFYPIKEIRVEIFCSCKSLQVKTENKTFHAKIEK